MELILPELNDSLIAVYIEVLAVLFVVAVGPEIIQVFVSPEIKLLMNRFPTIFKKITPLRIQLSVIWFFIAVSVLIWLIPPTAQDLVNLPHYATWKKIVAPGIVCLTFLQIISLRIYFFKNSLKHVILNQLVKVCKMDIGERGIPADDNFNPLVLLGIHSDPGEDKNEILAELSEIGNQIQTDPRYDGKRLQMVLTGIEESLINKIKPGDGSNFETVSNILDNYLAFLEHREMENSSDYFLIRRHLENIATTAISQKKPDNTILQLIQKIAYNRKTLFIVGVVALENQTNLVASAAFDKLEALAFEAGKLPLVPENCRKGDGAYLLGLIAHYWSNGVSARSWIQERLEEHTQNGIVACLENAFQYHTKVGNFGTADKLYKMKDEFNGKSTGRS